MATINSARPKRSVNLALMADGTWKIISDLSPAEIWGELQAATPSIKARLDALSAGEVDEPDDDDEDEKSQSPVVPSN